MENKICGIYMIRNKVNGKMYIGKSIDINRRWADHIKSLQSNSHYNEYNNMVLLALYTGMRIGEVLALTIDDLDFDEEYGTINVNKTLTKTKSGKIIVGKVTKTKKGKRNLHLDKVSKEVTLKAIKEKN